MALAGRGRPRPRVVKHARARARVQLTRALAPRMPCRPPKPVTGAAAVQLPIAAAYNTVSARL